MIFQYYILALLLLLSNFAIGQDKPFEQNGKWGLKNIFTDSILIAPAFDTVARIQYTRYTLVQSAGDYGLYKDNKCIIKPQFEEIRLLRDYTAKNLSGKLRTIAVKQRGKWGLWEFDQIIVPTEYDSIVHIHTPRHSYYGIDIFKQTHFRVRKSGKWGIINGANEIVVPIKYESAINIGKPLVLTDSYKARKGLHSHYASNPITHRYNSLFLVRKKNSNYILNGNKKIRLIDGSYDDILLLNNDWTKPLYALAIRRKNPDEEEPIRWALGRKKSLLSTFDYNHLTLFTNDILIARTSRLLSRFNLLKMDGTLLFEDTFYNINAETNIVTVINKNSGKHQNGVLNRKKNKYIIEPGRYDQIKKECNFFIVEKNGQKGVTDSVGIEVVFSNYDDIDIDCNYKVNSKNPVVNQFFVTKDSLTGILDKNGETIIPVIFTDCSSKNSIINNNFYKVKREGKWGIFDIEKNDFLISPQYQSIYQRDSYIIGIDENDLMYRHDKGGKKITRGYDRIRADGMVKLKEKWGIINKLGEEVLPLLYDKIVFTYINNRKIVARKNSSGKLRYGVVDDRNNVIIPLNYDDVQIVKHVFVVRSENNYNSVRDTVNNILFENRNITIKKIDKYGIVLEKDSLLAIADDSFLPTTPFEYEEIDGLSNVAFRVKKDSKWGVVTDSGQVKLPCEYDDISRDVYRYKKIRLDNKVGLIDTDGNLILSVDYDSIYTKNITNVTLVPVHSDGSWKYISPVDKTTVAANYKKIFNFNDKRAVVIDKNDKYFLINHSGELITKTGYDEIFSPKLNRGQIGWKVRNGDKLGWIDSKGDLILPVQYDKINYQNRYNLFYTLKRKVQVGNQLFSAKGELITSFRAGSNIYQSFGRNIAYFHSGVGFDAQRKKSFYFPDKELLSPAKYISYPYNKIDKSPKRLYTGKTQMSDEYFISKKLSSFLYAIGKRGKGNITEYLYAPLSKLQNGFIALLNGYNLNKGYLDFSNNSLKVFEDVQTFANENTPIRWVKENDGYYLINQKLEKINEEPLEEVGIYSEELIAVQRDKKVGFMDAEGKMVIPLEYDTDYSHFLPFTFENGIAYIYKDGKYGFINKQNKVVLPFKYDIVLHHTSKKTWVLKNNKWETIEWEILKK